MSDPYIERIEIDTDVSFSVPIVSTTGRVTIRKLALSVAINPRTHEILSLHIALGQRPVVDEIQANHSETAPKS